MTVFQPANALLSQSFPLALSSAIHHHPHVQMWHHDKLHGLQQDSGNQKGQNANAVHLDTHWTPVFSETMCMINIDAMQNRWCDPVCQPSP